MKIAITGVIYVALFKAIVAALKRLIIERSAPMLTLTSDCLLICFYSGRSY